MRVTALINWDVVAKEAQRQSRVGMACREVLRAEDREAAFEMCARSFLSSRGYDERRQNITLLAEAFGINRRALKRELRAAGLCGAKD